MDQPDLFPHVLSAYAGRDDGKLDNDALYKAVAESAGIDEVEMRRREKIGRAGKSHNVVTREIRWHQQTLKHQQRLRRVDGQRGVWELATPTKNGLHHAGEFKLVAFSTRLGMAVWGSCASVFSSLHEQITLVCTSAPFPLRKPRDYGNVRDSEYTDFMLRALEPLVRNLVDGGSICLELGADIFCEKSPARSLYRERLAIALCEKFSLFKMDDLLVVNPSRPPGPVQWASIKRVHLNAGYTPILWLTNNPLKVRSDNRRVLVPHTERHKRFLENGGIQTRREYANGAHTQRPGGFGAITEGKIPRNVIIQSHNCADTRAYLRDARDMGLPLHGAIQPLAIPEFLINFLSSPEDLIADPFGGTVTTGRAAETLGRRWVVTEVMLEYLLGGAKRFASASGFHQDEWFANAA